MSTEPPVARYQQVANQLRDAINRGEHKPGEALPSESQLVERFGLSRVTIRQAVGVLRAEGLVRVEHGRGAFVRPAQPVMSLRRTRLRTPGARGFMADMQAQNRPYWVRTDIRRGPAPDAVAQRLKIEPGADVLLRDRAIGEEGDPALQLATSYYPAALVEEIPRLGERDTGRGASALIEERGYQLHRVESVNARMPTPEQARQLELPPGVPVLRLIRVTFDQNARPVETMTSFVSNLVELVYEAD